MKNLTTKTIALAAAAFFFASTVSAKTYTAINSGKWSDAKTWENGTPGNEISTNDVVVVKSHITINTEVAVQGTLIIEKGFTVISNRSIHVTTTGTIVNNGNVTFKKLINEGKINNNSMIEAMGDIENRGDITNNSNAVAGTNLLNFGGSIQGKKGAYFANANVIASSGAVFGNDVKIYHSGDQNTGIETAMKLDADVLNHTVLLSVENPNKETVKSVVVERSFDGKNYSVVAEMSASSLVYQDKNIDSELVHYKVKVNGSTYLPTATVKIAGESSASIR